MHKNDFKASATLTVGKMIDYITAAVSVAG